MRTFIVYSSARCPWCTKVIDLIRREAPDAEVQVRTLTGRKCPNYRFMQEQGHKTVPQVYVATGAPQNRHIGGYEAVEAYFEELTRGKSAGKVSA